MISRTGKDRKTTEKEREEDTCTSEGLETSSSEVIDWFREERHF